jgi:hypothetical protein
LKQPIEKTSSHKKYHNYEKIIGLLLIAIGIVFLFIPILHNLKISATLAFLGFIVILMKKETPTRNTINHIQLILIIIILILVVWIITIDADFDIFLLLLIIVLLTLKEFVEKFLSPQLQKRMSILFYVLLIFFVIIFLQRIINILNMYLG